MYAFAILPLFMLITLEGAIDAADATLASALHTTPLLSILMAHTPPASVIAVTRCLVVLPRLLLHDAFDAYAALRFFAEAFVDLLLHIYAALTMPC